MSLIDLSKLKPDYYAIMKIQDPPQVAEMHSQLQNCYVCGGKIIISQDNWGHNVICFPCIKLWDAKRIADQSKYREMVKSLESAPDRLPSGRKGRRR